MAHLVFKMMMPLNRTGNSFFIFICVAIRVKAKYRQTGHRIYAQDLVFVVGRSVVGGINIFFAEFAVYFLGSGYGNAQSSLECRTEKQ